MPLFFLSHQCDNYLKDPSDHPISRVLARVFGHPLPLLLLLLLLLTSSTSLQEGGSIGNRVHLSDQLLFEW